MQHIHIMGIGGIGMSGIARILVHKGYVVSGCDASYNTAYHRLHDTNIHLYTQPCSCPCNASGYDILVHSAAIRHDHPEIHHASSNGIPVYSRAQILPYITHNMFVIAVSGTHGKTTTTGLIGHLLVTAGIDPTVLVGGTMKTWNSNVYIGASNILVIEADESDKSLLQITPDIAIITNLDYDHMATYADMDDTFTTFQQFLQAMNAEKLRLICADDTNLTPLAQTGATRHYGWNNHASYQCIKQQACNQPHKQLLTLKINSADITVTTHLRGYHNARNIAAAAAVGDLVGLTSDAIQSGLETFSGIGRRCDLTQYYHGIPCYDDYAHHPTEITNTLTSLLTEQHQNPCIIFQPHRYSRFASLWHDFINAFASITAGHVIVTDVFSAGEPSHKQSTAQQFAYELSVQYPHLHVAYTPHPYLHPLRNYIQQSTHYHDIYITLGAGDITQLHHIL